jgi:hypothetical protein
MVTLPGATALLLEVSRLRDDPGGPAAAGHRQDGGDDRGVTLGGLVQYNNRIYCVYIYILSIIVG